MHSLSLGPPAAALWPAAALASPLHNPPPCWVHQPRPCHDSSLPSCLSPPLLPVWVSVSSLSPWLSDFHTVGFSVSSGCFLFLNCCWPSFGCARRHSVSSYASILARSQQACVLIHQPIVGPRDKMTNGAKRTTSNGYSFTMLVWEGKVRDNDLV